MAADVADAGRGGIRRAYLVKKFFRSLLVWPAAIGSFAFGGFFVLRGGANTIFGGALLGDANPVFWGLAVGGAVAGILFLSFGLSIVRTFGKPGPSSGPAAVADHASGLPEPLRFSRAEPERINDGTHPDGPDDGSDPAGAPSAPEGFGNGPFPLDRISRVHPGALHQSGREVNV